MNRREAFYKYHSSVPRNPNGLIERLLFKLCYITHVFDYMSDFGNRRFYEKEGSDYGFMYPRSIEEYFTASQMIVARLIELLLGPILMPVHQIRVVIYDLLHRPSEDAPSVRVVIGDTVGDTKKDVGYWLMMHEDDGELKPLGFTRELKDKHDRDVLEEHSAFISLAVPKLPREMEHCDYVPRHIRFMNVQKRPL